MVLVRLDDGRIVEVNESLADAARSSKNFLVEHLEITHPDDVRAAQTHRLNLNSA